MYLKGELVLSQYMNWAGAKNDIPKIFHIKKETEL